MVDLRVMAYFLVPHCVSTTCKQESLCVRLVVPPFHHEGLGSASIEFLLPNNLGWPLQHEVWLWSETVVLRDVTWVPCPVRAIPAKETSRLNVCTSEACTHVSPLLLPAQEKKKIAPLFVSSMQEGENSHTTLLS